jgi:hypothetical protein
LQAGVDEARTGPIVGFPRAATRHSKTIAGRACLSTISDYFLSEILAGQAQAALVFLPRPLAGGCVFREKGRVCGCAACPLPALRATLSRKRARGEKPRFQDLETQNNSWLRLPANDFSMFSI